MAARALDAGDRNVRQDAGQDVVEIVRDTTREHTHALQLLMAQALLGDLALERHVAQHENHAARGLVRAPERRRLQRDQPDLSLPRTKLADRGSPVGQDRCKTRRGRNRGARVLRCEVDQLADDLVIDLVRHQAKQRLGGRVHELNVSGGIDSHDTFVERTQDRRQFVGEPGKLVRALLDQVLEVFAVARQLLLHALRLGDVSGYPDRHEDATLVIAQRRLHRVENLYRPVRAADGFFRYLEHLAARVDVQVIADVLRGVVDRLNFASMSS